MANQHDTVSFPVTSLRIGTWSRFTSAMTNPPSWDLECFAQNRQLIWQIQDGGHQFRISIDIDGIQQLVLSSEMTTGDVTDEPVVVVDQLAIQLYHPGDVTFSMWRNGLDHEWIRCGDFSENKQASFQSIHVLQGMSLRPALLQLFGIAPDLFGKCTMDNSPPPLDLTSNSSCPPRSFTSSPSATPEPFSATSTSPAACWMNAAAAAAAAAAAESFLSKPMVDWAWQQQQQQQQHQQHAPHDWSTITATGAVAPPPSIAFASTQESPLGHLM
ncbi:hypothetical protein BX666DRAFT_695561 [Dichotomocladium elegans]|nr:hypothetical protein BX666DRAFT_695561 [Dichotomocladium elegans]